MSSLFPHDTVREHQDELLADVTTAVEEGTNLVAHAPTGLGKTAAVLSPALEYALEHDKTVFFLTPRHSQHEIAVETLQEIREKHGTDFVMADLIGKRYLCDGAMPGVVVEDDNTPDCPRYEQTYDEHRQLTSGAKQQLAALRGQILRAEEVKERCDSACPYELLMHMAAQADVVIGDYFHIFHPGVRDVIFSKSSTTLKDCVVIVDEGHNLPGRTRDLHSATLTENMVDRARKEARNHGMHTQEELLERLGREVQRLAKHELGMDEQEVEIDEDTLSDRVETLQDYDAMLEDLFAVANEVREEGKESTCDDICQFFEKWRGTDDGFVRVLKRDEYGQGDPYVKISYTCLDPQHACKEPLNASHAAVVMSGTMTPTDMYVDILGMDERDTRSKAYESPFPADNKKNLIVDKVTTKYDARGDSEYQKMAWYITKSIEASTGNAGVFFPSYKMRDQVHEILQDKTDAQLFLERRGMDKEEKNEFLDRFAGAMADGKSAALLGVIGGSFGEGVDYPGQLMSTVMVVGVPLQRPDLETQALIDFYDARFGRGWDYGYKFPAMNRAIQAAGRCIRSADDRGVVVYLDERYTWRNYREVFPPNESFQITQAPWQEIGAFFN